MCIRYGYLKLSAFVAMVTGLLVATDLVQGQPVTFQGLITTVAGTGTPNFAGDGGPAASASFNSPLGVAVDRTGNVIIADGGNNRVRVFNTHTTAITMLGVTIGPGEVATVAGNGTAGYSGDDGPATSAALKSPYAVALDAAGNLYIADENNFRVRKVNRSGIITTVAGTGAETYGGDGGPATSAAFDQITGVAVDGAGVLYIADPLNARIRAVNMQASTITVAGVTIGPGDIATVAGNGGNGYSGNNGPATNASIGGAMGVAVDSKGVLYIADGYNYLVLAVNTGTESVTVAGVTIGGGDIAILAGTGSYGTGGDRGPATSADLADPTGVAVDSAGNLYVCSTASATIRKVSTNGIITTVAGNTIQSYGGDSGPAVAASLNVPYGVAVNSSGGLYIADTRNNRIRMVQTMAVDFGGTDVGQTGVTYSLGFLFSDDMTVSGTGVTTRGAAGMDFQRGSSCATGYHSSGSSCTVDVTFSPEAPGVRDGAVLIVDNAGHALITLYLSGIGTAPAIGFTPGMISTVAGGGGGCERQLDNLGDGCPATSAALGSPSGVAFDGVGNLYIADNYNQLIRKVDTSGNITVAAGGGAGCLGQANGFGDGCLATSATLGSPMGVTVDGAGHLYIMGSTTLLRKVDASTGIITTLAGGGRGCEGQVDSLGDGCPATSATLSFAMALAADARGNIYIPDANNNRVRKVDASTGIITTVAGGGAGCAGQNNSLGDGCPATSAQLNYPEGAAVDGVGDLYIADGNNNRIRKVDTSTGLISTVAGGGSGCEGQTDDVGDGCSATSALLNYPFGLALDAAGNFYIADDSHRVRRVSGATGVIETVAGNGMGAYSTDGVPATGSELYLPKGLAIDKSGNLYIADLGNNRIRKVNVTDPPPSVTFPSTFVGEVSAAQDVRVENVGNAALQISQITATSGYNLQGPDTTCSGSGQVLNTASSCMLGIEFAPLEEGTVSGSVVLTDNALNASSVAQTILVSGTGRLQEQEITFPSPGTLTYGVAPITLAAWASSGLPVSYSVIEGPAVVNSSTLTINGAGSVTVEARQPGNTAWSPASSVSRTFTVAPAVLTVTADNKAMSSAAQVAPTLTASYSGFVNGDTTGVLKGAPDLGTTSVPANAGSYPIDISQGSLGTDNYEFSFVPGTLVITEPSTPTLNFLNNYFVTGDHIVRSFDHGGTMIGGMVTGTITIPAVSEGQEGVPAGADIVAAFLYWQILETTDAPSSASGSFNGYPMTGSVVGSDLQSSCWSSNGQTPTMRAYRANVLPYLPVINGATQAVGPQTVSVPANTYGTVPGNASLVVIYRVLSNMPSQYPLKATVIYDGNWSLEYGAGNPASLHETINGFYDADGPGGAKITDIFGTVVNNGSVGFSPATSSGYTWPLTVPEDASGITMPNHYGLQVGQCYVWAAVVMSTAVKNSDNDGLLDSWKRDHGYTDVRDSSTWVDLSAAQPGRKDLFVQLDYMSGTPETLVPSLYPSQAALDMVTNAFANHGIAVHFVPGNAIPADTCTDDTSTTPPSPCMFPGEPGVVAWKTGIEVMKAWPKDIDSCAPETHCAPRFPIARKDSYHYLLLGQSLALPRWSIQSKTLVSIEVTGGTATVTTSAPITNCPSRITIDGALAAPNLNGVYPNVSCNPDEPNKLTVPNVGVDDRTFPGTLPEPQLVVYTSTTDTSSGFSDVGGGDTTVTLGKWFQLQTQWNPKPTQSKLDFEQGGTIMHELGHSLGLLHGGRYYRDASGMPTSGANCKPNYQSVMSYLFQVDGMQSDQQGNRTLDYSDRALDGLNEDGALSVGDGIGGPQSLRYPFTKWFAPTSDGTNAKAASSHCDGSPITASDFAATMYEMEGVANWSGSQQDINYDGSLSSLDGYSDWANLDLRQVGASANDYTGGPIYMINGEYRLLTGGNDFGGGGGIRWAGGQGGGIRWAGGQGGGIRWAGGQGGGIRWGSGTGGGIRWGSGTGGGIRWGSGTGGGMEEADYPTIGSYARPPRAVAMAEGVGLTWRAATFGQVQAYVVYRVTGTASTAIACVHLTEMPPQGCPGSPVKGDGNATAFSYTDPTGGESATYLVSAWDVDPAGQLRESTPAAAMTNQGFLAWSEQTLSITQLPYKSSESLLASGGSTGAAVTYNLVSGPCSLVGAVLTANSSTGSCSVTATMAGNSSYYPVTGGLLTVNLVPAPVTATAGSYSGVYDGHSHAPSACTVTGNYTGDLTCTNSLLSVGPNAGSGAIVPTVSGTGLGDFSITKVNGSYSIGKSSTSTMLSATPNPAKFGESVALTARVTAVAPGAGTPSGTITFKDGSVSLATVTMSDAAAAFASASLAAGVHGLGASYSGDANFKSSSGALPEQVACGVIVGLSPSTVRWGGTVRVTGQVISCATTAQKISVRFTLNGTLQPNKCSRTQSVIFTTPPFTLPARTLKSVSFPMIIPNGTCTGTFTITATTLASGTVLNSSSASLTISR
jgi:hypothetical protein